MVRIIVYYFGDRICSLATVRAHGDSQPRSESPRVPNASISIPRDRLTRTRTLTHLHPTLPAKESWACTDTPGLAGLPECENGSQCGSARSAKSMSSVMWRLATAAVGKEKRGKKDSYVCSVERGCGKNLYMVSGGSTGLKREDGPLWPWAAPKTCFAATSHPSRPPPPQASPQWGGDDGQRTSRSRTEESSFGSYVFVCFFFCPSILRPLASVCVRP